MSAVKQLGSALFGEQRISYRRMLAFLTGTALLVYGYIGSSEWLNLAMVFVAAEALPRTARAATSAFARAREPSSYPGSRAAAVVGIGNSGGADAPEGK